MLRVLWSKYTSKSVKSLCIQSLISTCLTLMYRNIISKSTKYHRTMWRFVACFALFTLLLKNNHFNRSTIITSCCDGKTMKPNDGVNTKHQWNHTNFTQTHTRSHKHIIIIHKGSSDGLVWSCATLAALGRQTVRPPSKTARICSLNHVIDIFALRLGRQRPSLLVGGLFATEKGE